MGQAGRTEGSQRAGMGLAPKQAHPWREDRWLKVLSQSKQHWAWQSRLPDAQNSLAREPQREQRESLLLHFFAPFQVSQALSAYILTHHQSRYISSSQALRISNRNPKSHMLRNWDWRRYFAGTESREALAVLKSKRHIEARAKKAVQCKVLKKQIIKSSLTQTFSSLGANARKPWAKQRHLPIESFNWRR